MANEITPNNGMFDRRHASKIFVDNNYGLSPKYGWLFHVSFELNPEIARVSNDDSLRMGFVVKSASLPKFSVDTKTLNAYNRVDIVQSKVKYDTVTIKFHDDNLDVIRNFWYDYYSYFYRDADWNLNIYSSPSKYTERQQQNWGYSPRQYPASSPSSQQYINSIKIYSLHNKKFAEYTLINPIITSFQHGEHAQGGDAGTLENTMTLQFQAVKYAYGTVSPDTVSGFAMLQYDSKPSPLGTTPVRDNTVRDLASGATGLPGIINNFKNLNGAAILGGAISGAASGLLSGGLETGLTKLGGVGTAVAGGLSKAGAFLTGKIKSNGLKLDTSASLDPTAGLPSDGASSSNDIQSQIDQEIDNIAITEAALDDAQTEYDALIDEITELQDQIDADKELLSDPGLSDEDIEAIQAAIDENEALVDDKLSRANELQDSINTLQASLDESRAKLEELQAAQNPSGNSEEDGGPGEDSVTETYDDGSSVTTNPDGSTTTIDSDGNIYTTPQQRPVGNPNASSNQHSPADW